MTPLPLATDRPRRLLLWPDYADADALSAALRSWCAACARRDDVVLALRWDAAVDPPLAEALAAVERAGASIDAAPPLLVVDDALDATGAARLSLALSAAVRPADPVRAAWIDALAVPQLADPRALDAALDPAPAGPELLVGLRRLPTPGDLRPVPASWRADGPDYVGVGVPKAGTTWWSQVIEAHPQVVPNRLGDKELHVFAHFGWGAPTPEHVATYRAAFARPDGALCGEFTPGTLTHPGAIDLLADVAPDTRVIVVLRDPVARAVSMLNQLARARAPYLNLTGERARVLWDFSLFPEAIAGSRVAPGLRRLRARFPADRVLILQYEALRADPDAGLARTWAFLGLPPHTPAVLHQRVHAPPHVLDPPDDAGRARLWRMVEDDVAEVAKLAPEIDTTLWGAA